MKVIKSNSVFENKIIVKNSRFICLAKFVANKEELNIFLKDCSLPDARHNCYAYKIGTENFIGGYDDNGEPKGTAGKPIFNVIEKNDLTNICILVIRYFGGIKLGAGPLTRAYTTSASEMINQLELVELEILYEYKLQFSITNSKEIDVFLKSKNIKIKSKNFSDKVTVEFVGKESNLLSQITYLLISYDENKFIGNFEVL